MGTFTDKIPPDVRAAIEKEAYLWMDNYITAKIQAGEITIVPAWLDTVLKEAYAAGVHATIDRMIIKKVNEILEMTPIDKSEMH